MNIHLSFSFRPWHILIKVLKQEAKVNAKNQSVHIYSFDILSKVTIPIVVTVTCLYGTLDMLQCMTLLVRAWKGKELKKIRNEG